MQENFWYTPSCKHDYPWWPQMFCVYENELKWKHACSLNVMNGRPLSLYKIEWEKKRRGSSEPSQSHIFTAVRKACKLSKSGPLAWAVQAGSLSRFHSCQEAESQTEQQTALSWAKPWTFLTHFEQFWLLALKPTSTSIWSQGVSSRHTHRA